MGKVSGLEGVVAAETEIGHVDGEQGHLVYRGYWAKELAVKYSFEEVANLLWYGQLPDAGQLEQLKLALKAGRALPEKVKRIIDLIPAGTPPMSVLRTAVSAMGGEAYAWPPTNEQAVALTALLPTVIAYRYRTEHGLSPIEPDPSLGHVENYLYMLTGERPEPSHAAALNAYFVLAMEHGMNASTFAARVVSSTQSDLVSAVCSAIGAMKGPLHGGAPSEVIAMLEEIGSKEHAEPWMRAVLEQGGRLMGFGHRVYKTADPRAEALRIVTGRLIGKDPWFDLALHVEETALRLLEQYKPGRRLRTNVEFYAAAVMKAVALPAELFTPTFTAGRIVGWTAHVLEQAAGNRIIRPQSVYVGAMPV